MILTCPKCIARYTVGEDAIPSSGRTVRCVSCGHTWSAKPESGQPSRKREPPPLFQGGASPTAPAPELDSVPPETEALDIEETFPNVDPVVPPPRTPPRPRGPPPALVWTGLGAILALVAVAAALFRTEVVRMWPKTAALYAAAGMPVNGVGLVIDQVRLTPAVVDGRAVLGVSGRIRNERDHPAPAAPLQVTLVDNAGAPLGRLIARPVGDLPPLETRYFSVVVRNPPPAVTGVALAFVSQAPETGRNHRTPVPQDARGHD